MLVDIHFDELQFALVITAQALKDRGNSTTGTTPGSPEIDDHRNIRLQHLRIKVLISNMDKILMRTHRIVYTHFPIRILLVFLKRLIHHCTLLPLTTQCHSGLFHRHEALALQPHKQYKRGLARPPMYPFIYYSLLAVPLSGGDSHHYRRRLSGSPGCRGTD